MQPLSDIKRLRIALGLTQADLAKRAQVSQSLIAKIEAGRLDPGYTKASHILETLASLSTASAPRAKDLMVRKIFTASPDDTVSSAISLMHKHGISQLPVQDGGAIVGLIAEHSLLAQISEGVDLSRSVCRDVMEEAPPIISSQVPAALLLDLLKVSPLAVIAEKGAYVGVVSRTDYLKAMGKR